MQALLLFRGCIAESIRYLENMLSILCEGAELTDAQSDNLVAWISENIPKAQWDEASTVCILYGCKNAYTDLSMRMGECGIQSEA